jgi:hypothetical protein
MLESLMAAEILPEPKRKWRRWPPEAFAIVQKKENAAVLCSELEAVSGNDRNACWRFLKKHGIERPGAGSRRVFSDQVVEAMTEYVSEHGVQAACQRFRCDAKSVYNLLHRSGFTHRARDSFSLREVCQLLRVRHSKVKQWLERGWLEPHKEISPTGRLHYIIDHTSLQRFCRERRDLLITRRWPAQRLAFLEEYVFAPKHADLLRTRESKREQEAYERGEFLESNNED